MFWSSLAFNLANWFGLRIRLKARRQSRMSRWSQALFPTVMPISALSRSGLSSVEKASFYSKMNTAKCFVREILFVRQQAKMHGVVNSGQEPLVYLAVTTPPQNFSSAYKTAESAIGS
jgi:hypothetical protein